MAFIWGSEPEIWDLEAPDCWRVAWSKRLVLLGPRENANPPLTILESSAGVIIWTLVSTVPLLCFFERSFRTFDVRGLEDGKSPSLP